MNKLKLQGLSLATVITLAFTGCGDSDSGNNLGTEIENISQVETISNIGNNINGLGYYGDGVIFGDTNITQGIWNVVQIDSNNQQISYDIKDTVIEWFSEDRITMLMQSTNSFEDVGYYGVSEDGKILKVNYESAKIQMIHRYISTIPFDNKKCMKVTIGENLKTYAMCNVSE